MEDAIEVKLRDVQHGCLETPIQDLGMLKEVSVGPSGDTIVRVQLLIAGDRYAEQVQADVEAATKQALDEAGASEAVVKVDIGQGIPRPFKQHAGDPAGLRYVGNVLAVSSCKGGVGKSTTAVGLALSLQRLGARVGLLDADVYGPSLPMYLNPEDSGVYKTDSGEVLPVMYGDLKCMSYGWIAARDEEGHSRGAFMRGPMVSNVVRELSRNTSWGQLDFLVVDMPPGTGDVHITIGQQLALTAAVTVTTPHPLSVADVAKGVDLFSTLKVPMIGLVENMAEFVCNHNEVYHPFGEPLGTELTSRFDIDQYMRLPITPTTIEMLEDGDSVVGAKFDEFSKSLVDSIVGMRYASTRKGPSFHVSWSTDEEVFTLRIFTDQGGEQISLDPRIVRLRCKCAECVDEMTGTQILKESDVDPGVQPVGIAEQGHYGIAVKWNDGHDASIYTYEQLYSMAMEK